MENEVKKIQNDFKKLELLQKDLAQKAEITEQAVSGWFKGKFKSKRLENLAKCMVLENKVSA